jgi:hypothetical protein
MKGCGQTISPLRLRRGFEMQRGSSALEMRMGVFRGVVGVGDGSMIGKG